MSEYIDKEKLLDALNKFAPEHYNASVNQFITKFPAADITAVIKCKNCRWWDKYKGSLQGRCALHSISPTGNWYCANGKRKEEE